MCTMSMEEEWWKKWRYRGMSMVLIHRQIEVCQKHREDHQSEYRPHSTSALDEGAWRWVYMEAWMGDRRMRLERMSFVGLSANGQQMPEKREQEEEQRHAPSTTAALSESLANTP